MKHTATLLLVLLCNAAASQVSFAAKVHIEPYAFATNDGRSTPAERGTFEAPLHHGVENGKTIRLSFVRFRSSNPNPGNPIVYLAGGPGGSGIEAARGKRFPMFMALRQVADVIVLDQRGTGASSPIPPCSVAKPPLAGKPLTREPYVAFMQDAVAHCVSFWRTNDIDLSAYNTRENALDLETLREALGASKLNLFGISYGSTLALAALKVMPDRVDRVVLASPLSMDQAMRLPDRTQDFLQRVAALIAADPRAKQAYPDFPDTMKTVLDRLGNAPVEVALDAPGGKPVMLSIGRFPIEMATVQMLKNPDTLRLLPMLYAAMAAGEYRPLAGQLLVDLSRPLTLDGMGLAVRAASCLSPQREAQVEAQAKTTLLGNVLNTETLVVRDAGIPRLDDDFCRPVESDVPTLVLTGTLDGRTYPAGHAEILRGLSNGTQVVIENAGHDLFMASPEVTADIVDFFHGRQLQYPRIQLPAPDFVLPPARVGY
jgi:pimeloyl-ACP methyl ester carboxylesterase